jgi:KaiC/GvpD/RAD55 family RecA-like ATPase
VIITEGEIDALSAYQMLSEYAEAKGGVFETAVVSPTTGANSHKQIAGQFRFFDSFENIVISYDNDKAGQTATEQLLKVLPKGKVKIMPMRYKDANEYLEKDKAKEFIHDFYDAKKQVPVGVLASSKLYDRIMGQTAVAKIPFPPFMQKLNELFVGGMPLGHIVNIAADTGIGKTTLVNELIYYWIFNSPHTVGIVSMELDAGQYGEVLLSRHLEKKLALIESQDEKMAYLSTDRVVEKAKELTIKEDGDSRFYLLDNRDGSIEEIQDTVEELVSACGAKVIVLDPLQDILDGLSNEEQAEFMKWAKGFIKSHGITFIFINHMRKTPAGQNGADSEQNIMGSSTIIKSASANILLKRDKMAESEITRNSTEISVTKNRVCGLTGPAGSIYYDNATHTLHSLDDWLNNH